MNLTLLPAAERRPMAWKNGGGVTREVAAFPPGAGLDSFDWRISIAEVKASGPFSRFPGVDRVLTVLQGAMRLRIAGDPAVLLTPDSGPHAFPGDVVCESEVIAPVVDLNLMVPRGLEGRVLPAAGPVLHLRTPVGVLIVTTPSKARDLILEPLDAVHIDGAGEIPFAGAGWLIVLGA